MCTEVNALNEKTFVSTSSLLQPCKSVSRTTDYSMGKSSLTYFRLRVATLITDNGRGSSRKYGTTDLRNYENWFKV